MSEHHHVDKKQYLIAKGSKHKIWNNGIVEYRWGKFHWEEQNWSETWEWRLEFIKLWEKAEIGKKYDFDWEELFLDENGTVTFLGFRKK